MREPRYYTQQVGQDGYQGIRTVRRGGIILWLHNRHQSDRLLPYVEQTVWVKDAGSLTVFRGGYEGPRDIPQFYTEGGGMECLCAEELSGKYHLRRLNPWWYYLCDGMRVGPCSTKRHAEIAIKLHRERNLVDGLVEEFGEPYPDRQVESG